MAVPAPHYASPTRAAPGAYRWLQLTLGVVSMVMIANLQYGWTLFVTPMSEAHGWSRTSIQVAFTIFILMQTWLVPLEGWLIDRFGPRVTVCLGGFLVGSAWLINSMAGSLGLLYLGAVLGGIGAGIVYSASVGNALKWFPDRRGLAAGLVAGGFGGGAALTVIPIANMIANQGYQAAFFWFGLGQGLCVMLAALFLRAPREGETPDAPVAMQKAQTSRDYTPVQVLKTPLFWLLYAMFVMVCAGGLMAVAQLGPIAKDFGVAGTSVSVLGLTLPALQFALAIDRVMNGLTRPFFGWVSDRIGRENTMFIAFGLEGIGIWALMTYGSDPLLFVLLSGLVFFAWGEIYSLFPSICTDSFGRRFATANYGLLYTAKGTAALLVPFASYIQEASGSWSGIFVAAMVADITAALLALLVVKPLRQAMLGAPLPSPTLPALPMGVIAGEASR